MIGEDLGSLSLKELEQLERKLKVGRDKIYTRKVHSLQEENDILKTKSSDEGHNSVASPRILSINVMDRLQFQPDCNVDGPFIRQNTFSEASLHPGSLQLGAGSLSIEVTTKNLCWLG
eukprot:Gb_10889 [translate_table: standard]